ncbi:MAG TPA: peptide chain release factor N(5)-glutamine methyltransferase [Bacteroidales bacterium]|nr:peptide chain release factor N(5)-glutamine methyltransferase [Bacteroidales bacterium]HNR42721.1 peptide chain release factor N(5)-glutamine methyltransferase [Bacteroidales bacterium]HPM17539.1 peptide chain release factor N(5)-glutamine methyltransferase [Bacteroidales bacterium]
MAFNLQTIRDIRNHISGELKEIYPEEEIQSLFEIMVLHILGGSKAGLLGNPQRRLTNEESERIMLFCNELKTGRPVQYITGETVFYNCRIRVGPEVLIPRPETEELVDLVLRENRNFSGTITDACTGSGCIAIALARNLPAAGITGLDNTPAALKTASGNALLNRVSINFILSDILKNGIADAPKPDIIVSNPPYVRESEKALMHRNVLEFEPHSALFVPDDDPLVFYRAILESGNRVMDRGGKIYFEINEAMGESMVNLMESLNYIGIRVVSDINGRDRIIKGTLK